MAYENLLKSVEESAQEKERELLEKARSVVAGNFSKIRRIRQQ